MAGSETQCFSVLWRLKSFHTAFSEDPSTRMYFNEEAQINAQLQHPGILPVYSYARTDSGVPYLTMKEVRGTTMKEIIQELLHYASWFNNQ